MAANRELPNAPPRAGRAPLLSPIRAVAAFSVAIVALLGFGTLLVTQLTQIRSGGVTASTTATSVASQPLAVSPATPTTAAAPEVQVARAVVGTPDQAGDRIAVAHTDGAAAAPDSTLTADGSAPDSSRTASVQAESQPGPAVGQSQPQPGDAGQPGEAIIGPVTSAATAPAGGPALPTIANLAGATVPVGPDGVTQPGALQFAQILAGTAQTTAAQPVSSDPVLDDLARQVLQEELASAQQRGYPQADVVSRDGATVRMEMVAVLPRLDGVKLTKLPDDVQTVGVAAGVSPRAEPGYMPDLVVVAAVSYR